MLSAVAPSAIDYRGLGVDAKGDLVVSTKNEVLILAASDGSVVRRIDVSGRAQDPNGGLISQQFTSRGNTAGWIDTDDRLWLADLSTGAVTDTGLDSVEGAELEADGTHFVVARADGRLERYRLGETTPDWTVAGDGLRTVGDVKPFTEATEGVGADVSDALYPTDIEFSPDGGTLYESRGYGIRVIDTASVSVKAVVPLTTEFATLGQLVTALSDGSGRIVVTDLFDAAIADPATGTVTPLEELKLRNPSDIFMGAVTISGDRFVVQHYSGTLTVFDSDGHVLDDEFDARVGRLHDVTESPNGDELYALGESGIARLSTNDSGFLHTSFDVPAGYRFVNPGPDGETLFVSDHDRGLPPRRWRCTPTTSDRCEEGAIDGASPETFAAPLDREGFFGGAFGGATVRMYDAATGQATSAEISTSSEFLGMFAPADRTWIALATLLPTLLEVYSLPNGEPVASLPLEDGLNLLTGSRSQPDRIVAFNITSGNARVVNTRTWTIEASPFEPASVIGAAFSEDGTLLATVGQSGEIVIRDGLSYERIRTLTGDSGVNGSFGGLLAFSDDDRYLLSAVDGQAQLWDVATGTPIGGPISIAPGVNAIAYSGTAVGFVGIANGRVQNWRLDPSTWKDLACQAAGRNLTIAEWQQYGPKREPYHQTCPQWPTGES